ncbi:hypothetical protein B296_00034280 [Ensete ventricosum]|uniref:Uncharacterized protein n=1 Tax=Ensete ventricosum TaxID=4639 RepID=A0A426Z2S0_ENSVE|nr:hypothetical protein B296_00034280 [Ensete ventricosum]
MLGASSGLRCGHKLSLPGVVTTRGRAACDDVYLPLHRAFRAEGRLSLLSYIPIEVATMYEVLDLVFQIITFFGVVFVVAVKAIVASVIPLYGSSRVECSVGEPGSGMLGSLGSLPREPRRWAPRGLVPQALQIFSLLYHYSLDSDILVGPL